MNEIQLKLDKNGRGTFVIENNDKRLAEMVIGISKGMLTVYHTEVNDELKGQGIGNKLLDKMVEYARTNKLQVIPLCKFVLHQFTRHSEKYVDIWFKDWHNPPK